MTSELVTEEGEILTEGKDFVYLNLKEGETINAKIEQAVILKCEYGYQPFIQMKTKDNPVILSYDSNLFHLIWNYKEAEEKTIPFFIRITGGQYIDLKNSSKAINACKGYQKFEVLGL